MVHCPVKKNVAQMPMWGLTTRPSLSSSTSGAFCIKIHETLTVVIGT